MHGYILFEYKQKEEMLVVVCVQLQKRLTWLEQRIASFLFQLHWNGLMRRNIYHIYDVIHEKKLSLFKFYAFISNIFIWLIAATLLFSHKAYITFCKGFNKLTIFLATMHREKKKPHAHCHCINHKSSLTWIKCIKSISVSGILPKTFENHEKKQMRC